jgi:hypothetical protein
MNFEAAETLGEAHHKVNKPQAEDSTLNRVLRRSCWRGERRATHLRNNRFALYGVNPIQEENGSRETVTAYATGARLDA